ncbi:MAG: MraY family glycosyltransferase [Desulfurivibrionaceae bacterium]
MNTAAITDLRFFLIVFFTALLCSLMLVPFSRKLALATGLLDHPDDQRKVHHSALPLLGGLGIAGAVLFSVAFCVKLSPMVIAYLLGAAIALFTGLLDDIVSIPPSMKFLGQILAALVFANGGGGELTTLGNLLGLGDIQLGPLSLVFTVIAMVGVMNAVNLFDGLDGLAGGISAIALVFFGLLAYTHQAWLSMAVILAVLGALLGFLRHNSHPARLFMGDTGSLFLGFTLAALAVRLATVSAGFLRVKPVMFAVILALPIADTLWVMGNRLRQGKNPFHPDKTHLHHRLLHLGLRHNEVVPVSYCLMFFLGGLAWLGEEWPEWWLFTLALMLIASLYAGINWAERQRLNLGRLLAIKHNSPARNLRLNKRLLQAMGRSSRIVFPLFLCLFFSPVLLTSPSPPLFGFMAFALALFIILLFPWQGGRKEMPLAHGLFFIAIFAILLSFWTNQPQPFWLIIHGNSISVFALLWVTPHFMWGQHGKLLPGSFELMLIVLAFFVPLFVAPTLGATKVQQTQLALIWLQAIPITMLVKLTVKRHPRRNRILVSFFIAGISGIGILSFFN